MNFYKQLTTILLMSFLISACDRERKFVLPENLELVAAKPEYLSAFKNYKEYKKTYVAYISDHDPKTQLYRIELAIQNSIEKGMGYMIYVMGTEKGKIEEILKKLNYKYAVYADVNSEFKTANEIDDLYYTGFIVDKQGVVINTPMINFRR